MPEESRWYTDTNNGILEVSEEDFKEIFALFTSSAKYERDQVYDGDSIHSFRNEDLAAEYYLSLDKREFAVDAWRAVLYFLHKHGFSAYKDGVVYDLSFTDAFFIE